MRFNPILPILLTSFTSLAVAAAVTHEIDRTISIFAWPLSNAKAQSLAKVTYNSTSATVVSYTPPNIPSASTNDVVRVGFYHPTGSWSGIATSALNFEEGRDKKLRLWLNDAGEVFHLGFSAAAESRNLNTEKVAGDDGELRVEIVMTRKGMGPHLNKPVVVSADGKEVGKEPEKTFLQKYWWMIAGFLVLQVVMSGGKGE